MPDDADDPVAQLHNVVAHEPDDVVASTRPPGTTAADLDRMISDVLAKLDLGPDHVVCEIGCGTGVLGLPLARRVAQFVGVDFAAEALGVLRRRLATAGLAERTVLVDTDILGPDVGRLAALGPFDRVLVYATFHYVANTDQAGRFLERVVELLAPGGKALIGNIPLADLAEVSGAMRTGSVPHRLAGTARWIRGGPSPVPRDLGWRVHALVHTLWNRGRRAVRPATGAVATAPHALPAGTNMALRIDTIESILGSLAPAVTHQWLAPAIGVPMFLDRADLLITRQRPAIVRPDESDR